MICQSQATWETIRGQHATQNEICSCQINHWEIFPCPFTSTCRQEKSFPGTERTSGLGAMQGRQQRGPTQPGPAQRTVAWEPGSPGPSHPAAYLPWDLGQVTPFSGLSWDFSSCEKSHPVYKSPGFYLSSLAEPQIIGCKMSLLEKQSELLNDKYRSLLSPCPFTNPSATSWHPLPPFTPGLPCAPLTGSQVPGKMSSRKDLIGLHGKVLTFSQGEGETQQHD